MSDTERYPSKLFTIDQANAMLPLVRAITEDLRRLSLDVVQRRERLNHLTAGRDVEEGNVYSEELAEIEAEVESDVRQLNEYVEELRQLGVEPKNGALGLIDFPSLLDGRLVYLCWQVDEPEVLHWHDLDAGFAGRQPLTVGSRASAEGAIDEGVEPIEP